MKCFALLAASAALALEAILLGALLTASVTGTLVTP